MLHQKKEKERETRLIIERVYDGWQEKFLVKSLLLMIEVPLLTGDSWSSWLVPHLLGYWNSGKQLRAQPKHTKTKTYAFILLILHLYYLKKSMYLNHAKWELSLSQRWTIHNSFNKLFKNIIKIRLNKKNVTYIFTFSYL